MSNGNLLSGKVYSELLNFSKIKIAKSSTLSNNAIIYARTSTAEQNSDEENCHSIATQVVTCEQYASSKGFNLIDTIEETRRAHNITKSLLYDILKDHTNIHLIVVDGSRLSRNRLEAVFFLEQCKKQNIIIHLVRDQAISNTMYGFNMVFNSVMSACIESEKFKQRVTESNNIKRALGNDFGPAPFGMKRQKIVSDDCDIPITKKVYDEHEQKIIKLIGWYYYGSKIQPFYRLFGELIGNPNIKLYYEDKEYTDIRERKCTMKYIAKRLNEYNLLNRNREWTEHSISTILKKIPEDERKFNDKDYVPTDFVFTSSKSLPINDNNLDDLETDTMNILEQSSPKDYSKKQSLLSQKITLGESKLKKSISQHENVTNLSLAREVFSIQNMKESRPVSTSSSSGKNIRIQYTNQRQPRDPQETVFTAREVTQPIFNQPSVSRSTMNLLERSVDKELLSGELCSKDNTKPLDSSSATSSKKIKVKKQTFGKKLQYAINEVFNIFTNDNSESESDSE